MAIYFFKIYCFYTLAYLRIGRDNIGYWAVQNNQMVDPSAKSKELGMSCESHFQQLLRYR